MTGGYWARRLTARLARLHGDESGSISISSVFAVILLVMLLGLVMNTGLQVDQKIKMQNAADAAAYSGAVVVGRGMNTLAFTNHLMADVFALTAFLREARERSAESLVPEILDNWERIGPALAGSEFQKFADLGEAIKEKVPREREVTDAFGDWAAAASDLMLPVFERILYERRIPEFQRALMRTTPHLAQIAADEIARRHGEAWPRRTALHGLLWRTNGDIVGGAREEGTRMLPVIDPVKDMLPGLPKYVAEAREQRFQLAHRYLRTWNDQSLPLFDRYVKMSQFNSLWRVFTGGQLQKLLEVDYPNDNLPLQIATRPGEIGDLNEHLERNYMYVGVVYGEKLVEQMPGIFHSPLAADPQAYAQVMVFVPRRRLIKQWISQGSGGGGGKAGPTRTGVPGQGMPVPGPPPPPIPPPPPPPPANDPSQDQPQSIVRRQSIHRYPEHWTMINQNWTAQLVPATSSSIPRILRTPPYGPTAPPNEPDMPDLARMTFADFLWLSNH